AVHDTRGGGAGLAAPAEARGMTLEYPGALWWLLLVPVILLLYILRTQRRRIPVASVRLWRGLEEELEARRNWRPPRPSWLLALQLAFVVAGALALAGPRLLRPAEGNHLVLVLDASASMGAADGAPSGEGSRFAEAQRQARERRRAGPGGGWRAGARAPVPGSCGRGRGGGRWRGPRPGGWRARGWTAPRGARRPAPCAPRSCGRAPPGRPPPRARKSWCC